MQYTSKANVVGNEFCLETGGDSNLKSECIDPTLSLSDNDNSDGNYVFNLYLCVHVWVARATTLKNTAQKNFVRKIPPIKHTLHECARKRLCLMWMSGRDSFFEGNY